MAFSTSPTGSTNSFNLLNTSLTNSVTSNSTGSSPITVNSSDQQHAVRRKRASFNDIFKLLVLGDEQVGKTALIVRFLTKKFIGEYENNLDIKYRHSDLIDNNQVLIEICDTCCNTRKNNNSSSFEENVKWAEGFVFVYDITRQSSFDYVVELRSKVVEIKKMTQVPMIFVANKSDLDHRRSVNRFEVERFITDNTILSIEVSVSNSYEEVREIFKMVCKEIILTKRRSRTFFNRVLGGIGTHKK